MGVPPFKTGWGTPSSLDRVYSHPVLMGGRHPILPDRRYAHPSGWQVLSSFLMGVTPILPDGSFTLGYSHVKTGWGTPIKTGWDPLNQDWLGIPPTKLDGVPPVKTEWVTPPPHKEWMGVPSPHIRRQSSRASTCYTADGMSLTFTQENFLV